VGLTLKVAVGAILAPTHRGPGSASSWPRTRIACSTSSRPIRTRTRRSLVRGCRAKLQRLGDLHESAETLAQQLRTRTLKMEYKRVRSTASGPPPLICTTARCRTWRKLLKPENQRPSKFYVGTRYFDPKNVGFTTLQMPGGTRVRHVQAGQTATRGTGRTARAAGASRTSFTDAERWALVEYPQNSVGQVSQVGQMGFTGFPPEAFTFFAKLAKNNNRDWFQAHKDVYERACREPMKALMAAIDPPFGADGCRASTTTCASTAIARRTRRASRRA
jgi:hypothetical protein